MADRPIVTIVMIFLNAEPFISEAIESVLAQTYKNWELLLVDDGSDDGSTAIAHEFASQHPGRIRYLDHPKHLNRGMSASRNKGIGQATGDYIAFLDADDVWLPDKLAYQLIVISSHPEAGMIYGNTLYWHSWTANPEDERRDYTPALGVIPGSAIPPPGLLELYLSGRAAVPCTCSILVRTDSARKVGGFEESFRGMYEDQAFYAKICITESVMVSESCLERYRQHPGSNCAITEASGRSQMERLRFLRWLSDYLIRKNIYSRSLWTTLRQEQWLIKPPSLMPAAGKFAASFRWMKKWILRAQNMLVPDAIRLWYWSRDVGMK